jgi:hypothetical protein
MAVDCLTSTYWLCTHCMLIALEVSVDCIGSGCWLIDSSCWYCLFHKLIQICMNQSSLVVYLFPVFHLYVCCLYLYLSFCQTYFSNTFSIHIMYYPVTQTERRSDWSTVWYCEISPLRTMFLFYMLDTLDRKSVRGHHYNLESTLPRYLFQWNLPSWNLREFVAELKYDKEDEQ